MKKIAILGASENQLALIIKAKNMGYETHVFAWQNEDPGEYEADYFYPISVTNKDLILYECQRLNLDGIATISSDLSALTIAHICREVGLSNNSEECVGSMINKIRTKRILDSIGGLYPKTVIIDEKFPAIDYSFPVVVKPSDRSGGKGVQYCENKEELRDAIDYARNLSFEKKAIVEEYIDAPLFSAECISYNGRHHLVGITENRYIRDKGKFIPYKFSKTDEIEKGLLKNVSRLVDIVLTAFGFSVGASNIEFFVQENQFVILEVSPTAKGEYVSSNLIPYCTGYDYLEDVVKSSCDLPICIRNIKQRKNASIVFRKESDNFLQEIIPNKVYMREE